MTTPDVTATGAGVAHAHEPESLPRLEGGNARIEQLERQLLRRHPALGRGLLQSAGEVVG